MSAGKTKCAAQLEAAVAGFVDGFGAVRAAAEAAEAELGGGPRPLPRFGPVLAGLTNARGKIARGDAQWLMGRMPPRLTAREAIALATGAGTVRWYAWLDLAWRIPPADWGWFIDSPLDAALYALLGPAGPPAARRKLCALRGLTSERRGGCPERASSMAMILNGRAPSWSRGICFLPGVSGSADIRRAIHARPVKDTYWRDKSPTKWLWDWVDSFLHDTGTELGLNDRDTGVIPEYFDPDVRDSLVLTLEDDMLGPTDGTDLYPYQQVPTLLRCRASAREFMRRRARAAWAAAYGYVAWRAAAALSARQLGRRAAGALRYAAWAGPAPGF